VGNNSIQYVYFDIETNEREQGGGGEKEPERGGDHFQIRQSRGWKKKKGGSGRQNSGC